MNLLHLLHGLPVGYWFLLITHKLLVFKPTTVLNQPFISSIIYDMNTTQGTGPGAGLHLTTPCAALAEDNIICNFNEKILKLLDLGAAVIQ